MSKATARPAVGVGVLVFNQAGKLLLGLRKGQNGGGTWGTAGGHVERFETIEETARREVEEETGINDLSEVTVMSYSNYCNQENDEHFLDVYVMAQTRMEPKLLEPTKCERWSWFDIDQLPQNIFRHYDTVYQNWLNRPENNPPELKPGIDYIGVTTAMFCHDGQGNFLLNKRTKRCRDEQDRWDAWGGKVEWGETIEQAARRELAEEAGAKIKQIEFAGLSEAFRIDPQGRKTHWLPMIFLVEIERGTEENAEPEKFEEIKWFAQGEWPTPLHSMFLNNFAIAERLLSEPVKSPKNGRQ